MKHLFTKTDCSKCQWIKDNLDLSGITIQNLDENPEALGLLAYYECVTPAEKNLPILVIGDDPFTAEKIFDFQEIVSKIDEKVVIAQVESCSGDNCKI